MTGVKFLLISICMFRLGSVSPQQNIPWKYARGLHNQLWKDYAKQFMGFRKIGVIDKKYLKHMTPTQKNPCVEYSLMYDAPSAADRIEPSDPFDPYQKTWQECQALCAKTPACMFWTWQAHTVGGRGHYSVRPVKTGCSMMKRKRKEPLVKDTWHQSAFTSYAISGPKNCPKVNLCVKLKVTLLRLGQYTHFDD